MANVTENLNDPYKFKINGGEYYCRFVITDAENAKDAFSTGTVNKGGLNTIDLTKSAIVSLDIHECFFEPHVKGSITLNNPFDYVENNHFSKGVGNDYLHMELLDYQVYKEGNQKVVGSAEPQGVRYAEERLIYSFVITAEDNSVSKSDRSNNFKTYQLVDKNWYKLDKKVPEDVYFPENNEPTPIGDVIKDILKNLLGDDVIDEENWVSGNHILAQPIGKDLEASPGSIHPAQHWKYSDVIKYLLKFNYSKVSDDLSVQTILQYNRNTEQYTLIPLDLYFKNNDKYVIEGFGIGDLTPADARQAYTGVKGNPKDKGTVPVNKYTGMVNNTDLTTPFTQYTNQFFVDYILDSNNTTTGTPIKSIVRVSSVLEAWKEEFIDHFELVGGKPTPFLELTTDRTANLSKSYSFPQFKHEDLLNLLKAQMASNFTFYNLELNLDNIGDTGRKPGRFVDVFRPSQDTVSGSDAKLLGRWLVTSVHHRFMKDQYHTILQCIKPYVSNIDPASVAEAENIPLSWTGEVDPSYMPPPDVLMQEPGQGFSLPEAQGDGEISNILLGPNVE
jgi:hypothetical protein